MLNEGRITITVTFPADLLVEIDMRAGELGVDRNDYLRRLASEDSVAYSPLSLIGQKGVRAGSLQTWRS